MQTNTPPHIITAQLMEPLPTGETHVRMMATPLYLLSDMPEFTGINLQKAYVGVAIKLLDGTELDAADKVCLAITSNAKRTTLKRRTPTQVVAITEEANADNENK